MKTLIFKVIPSTIVFVHLKGTSILGAQLL